MGPCIRRGSEKGYYRINASFIMPTISIIVPVYNTEQYLSRCIDSVLNQSFTNFELLLIDDGSTDNSSAICDAYTEKDDRIRVFHKENGGASSARNLGLDNAQGEWVVFVDSDDAVGDLYLEHLMSDDSDLVIIGLRLFSEGFEHKEVPCAAKYVSMKEMSMNWNLPEMNYLYCYPIAKRYRRDIITENSIRFDEDLFYQEDLYFVLSYMLHIDGFAELPYADYQYWITETYRAGKFKMNAMQLIAHYDALNGLFDKMEIKCKGKFNYVKNNVNLRLLRCFFVFLQNCPKWKEYTKNSRLFRNQNWSKYMLSLLVGKKEKRVLYGTYYCPTLSYLLENKIKKFLR